MSLYSRHKLTRENKPPVGKNEWFWYWFSHSEHVPEDKRGFWFNGIQRQLHPFYRQYCRKQWKKFAESMVAQIYNQSPIITSLLSNATVDM